MQQTKQEPVFLGVPIPGTDVKILCTGTPDAATIDLLIEYLKLSRIAVTRTSPPPPKVPDWIPSEWRYWEAASARLDGEAQEDLKWETN